MSAARDLTGMRFGRLVALERDREKEREVELDRLARGRVYRRRAFWRCRCDCGKSTAVLAIYLTTGGTQSCGCLRVESMKRTAERARKLRAVLAIRGRAFERTEDVFDQVFGHKSGPREINRAPKQWRGARPAALDLAACLGLSMRGRR